jgi:hypothetical protein
MAFRHRFGARVEGRQAQILEGLAPPTRNKAPAHRRQFAPAVIRDHRVDRIRRTHVEPRLQIVRGSAHRESIEPNDLRPSELVGEAATHSVFSTVPFDGDIDDGNMIADPRQSFSVIPKTGPRAAVGSTGSLCAAGANRLFLRERDLPYRGWLTYRETRLPSRCRLMPQLPDVSFQDALAHISRTRVKLPWCRSTDRGSYQAVFFRIGRQASRIAGPL